MQERCSHYLKYSVIDGSLVFKLKQMEALHGFIMDDSDSILMDNGFQYVVFFVMHITSCFHYQIWFYN